MSDNKKLTNNVGAPVADNQNVMTAGKKGPMLLQDVWFLEKLAHFDREVIPERRMHAKGSGAFGTFTVTHDITKYTKAKIYLKSGEKQTFLCASLPLRAKEVLQMQNAILEGLQLSSTLKKAIGI
jgi:catalase